MHRSNLTFICFLLAFPLTLPSPARSQLIHPDNPASPFLDLKRLSQSRKIAIEDLRSLTDSVGIEVCKQRYGTGYTVSPAPNGRHGQFVSDMGHTFTLYSRSELQGSGIYAEHSQVIITYPDQKEQEATITQFVTGFTDSKRFSGVFSDGTCAGKFAVVEAQ